MKILQALILSNIILFFSIFIFCTLLFKNRMLNQNTEYSFLMIKIDGTYLKLIRKDDTTQKKGTPQKFNTFRTLQDCRGYALTLKSQIET